MVYDLALFFCLKSLNIENSKKNLKLFKIETLLIGKIIVHLLVNGVLVVVLLDTILDGESLQINDIQAI